MKTDEELKQLAMDIYKEKVFTNFNINPEEMNSTFMPLCLMVDEEIEKFKEKKPTLIYEYMNSSASRSVNGHPVFFSFQYLVKEEHEIMAKYYNKFIDLAKVI